MKSEPLRPVTNGKLLTLQLVLQLFTLADNSTCAHWRLHRHRWL